MGEYQLAKAAGFSDIGAAFAGREVATDFGMKGSNVLLNALIEILCFLMLVFKVYIELGRLFFENAVNLALISATIVAPEIALYHINSRLQRICSLDR